MAKKEIHISPTPKDVFMQLLVIITLYFSAISFVTLLFQYINRVIPDPLTERTGYAVNTAPLRFAVASLVIVFPAYMLLSWYINRDFVKHPAKREMTLHRWLITFTLFVAALIIGGDLISLINNYLGGDLTSRFALQSLSILVIAASVFGYYIWDLRAMRSLKHQRIIAMSVAFVVACAVITAFFVSGSPQKQRMMRFDMQRVYDLQSIQSQVFQYWQNKEVLPQTLTDLEDDISGYTVPTDPETKALYTYRNKGGTTFVMCAMFNLEGTGDTTVNELDPRSFAAIPETAWTMGGSWKHSMGTTCFERTIDKDLYQLPKK